MAENKLYSKRNFLQQIFFNKKFFHLFYNNRIIIYYMFISVQEAKIKSNQIDC